MVMILSPPRTSKYSLAIHHPPSNLPDISINEVFALSTMFRALVSRVDNTSNRSKYGCCYTKMDDDYNDDPHATKCEEHSFLYNNSHILNGLKC